MMKKTIFILTALAALACTAISCRKEFAEMRPGTGFTVTATIAGGGTAENGTKVSANDGGSSLVLKWEQGDKLIGFDDASPRNTYGFEVTAVAGGKATLTRIEDGDEDERGTATTDPADGTTMYMLYVPGKKPGDIDVTTNPANPSLTVDISRQTVKVPVLMTAQGTVQNGTLTLNFAVRTALIGVKAPTMATENEQYSSIVLTSTGMLNNQVKFDLSGTGGTLNATYSQAIDGATSESVTSITKETSFSSGSDKKVSDIIYIAACPFSQTAPGEKLTFTAVTAGDDKEALTKEGITSVDAGKYYHISPTFASSGRTITVSFGPETANFFGGGSLTFNTSKKIRVYSSATDYEDIDVLENAASVTITTNLDGPVTLAYPADLASDSEKALKVGISTALDASSVRAMATIGASDAAATLENPTAVFKVTLPSLTGMTGLEIKSLPPASATSRSGTKADINTEGTDKTVATINPASGSTFTSGGTYYVFLKPGVKLCDLAFDATTGDHTGTMAGIPGSGSSEATAENNLYEVDGANFHEYIKVGDVKWAKTNIGATTEIGRGKYFMWGETTGHTVSGTLTKSSTSPISNAFTEGFALSNAPYCKNNNYTKYTSSDSTLELMDDAAYVNWGGPWSMPTKDNFSALCSNSGTMEHTDSSIDISSSSYGYRISVTGGTIFFPANGYGNAQSLYDFGSTADPTFPKLSYYRSCLYWINTYNGTKPYSFTAYDGRKKGTSSSSKVTDISLSMTPNATKGATNDNARYYGFPIRPVSTY